MRRIFLDHSEISLLIEFPSSPGVIRASAPRVPSSPPPTCRRMDRRFQRGRIIRGQFYSDQNSEPPFLPAFNNLPCIFHRTRRRTSKRTVAYDGIRARVLKRICLGYDETCNMHGAWDTRRRVVADLGVSIFSVRRHRAYDRCNTRFCPATNTRPSASASPSLLPVPFLLRTSSRFFPPPYPPDISRDYRH